MKKGFTLSEVMIVLVVIGVITGILLPTAIQSTPDENVMKFKKSYNTVGQAIRELVTSDKYYCNGDLGIKADCTTKIYSTTEVSYFCKTLSDILNVKEETCRNESISGGGHILLSYEFINQIATGEKMVRTVTAETIEKSKKKIDSRCKEAAINIGKELTLPDGTILYQGGTSLTFGSVNVSPNETNGLENSIKLRYFSPPDEFPANYGDKDGIDIAYKIFCIDVDGIPSSATEDECVNECPFGLGIHADGKIFPGARATEWINKKIQKED